VATMHGLTILSITQLHWGAQPLILEAPGVRWWPLLKVKVSVTAYAGIDKLRR
jgi:hypothetical protein